MRRPWTWLAVIGLFLAGGSAYPAEERCSARHPGDASLQVRHLPPHLRPDRVPGDPECTVEANAGSRPTPFPGATCATSGQVAVGAAVDGYISGTVTDAATTLPLANVEIEIHNCVGGYAATTYTNSSGVYTSSGLPPGIYYASTWNSLGYLDELYNNIACPGGSCTVTSGTGISVTAGTTTSGIDFGLGLGGGISGTVTDAGTGLPLGGVEVDIYNSAGSLVTYGYASSVTGVLTGFSGLPSGTYHAVTYNYLGYIDELYNNIACPGSCTVTSGTAISVTVGMTTTGIDFALAAGGRISGTVTDAGTALPLTSTSVYVYSSSGSQVTRGYTDSSGVYTTESGLPSGTYYARTSNSKGYIDELYNNIACPGSCTATSGTAITVTVGMTTSGIDFGLARGGGITGTVTDAGTGLPLANVDVDIYSSAGSYVTYGYTNSSGVYTSYRGLSSGTYYARTWNASGYIDELYNNISCPGGACTVASGTAITVSAGATTTGIDFGMARGGRISGTVTDAGTSLPLAEVAVYVHNSTGGSVTSVSTDSSGVYTTYSGLPSGTYYARTSNYQGYFDELYNDIPCPGGSCTVTSGTAISVTLGTTTTGIDFGLARGGRISGTVTDAGTSLPLAGVLVYVYNSSGSQVTNGYTNSSGVYTSYSGLSSGTYYAVTWNSLGYVDELYNNISCPGGACTVTSGTAISVTVGATTTGIDFSLAAGGRISGTVTDAATTLPLDNLQVRVYNSSGTQVTSGYTDSSGVYVTSSGLLSGTYYARTSNSQGYIDELYNDIPCPGGTCTVTSGTPISVTVGTTTMAISFGLDSNPGLSFYTVVPCRVLDTRKPDDPLGGPALVAGTERTFPIAGNCLIPATAKAVSANVTVTRSTSPGNVRLYPAGAPMPLASTINYATGQTRANNAIIPLNVSGQTAVIASPSGTVHFILDVNGYFQ
jgi:Carboxypeptidase regulatory-like domain